MKNVITTISVNMRLKRKLDEAKGKEDWDTFIEALYIAWKSESGKRAFEAARKMLTKGDMKSIEKSYKEFRKGFVLR
ncbi:MAG: hypothetical protein KGH54_01980 [Candidatus Micrarchaeota archaeon]|nr:hypothetical protein [Candidatus Micrarchaeota archaeon]